jgi:Flp pilus assembly protein TadG
MKSLVARPAKDTSKGAATVEAALVAGLFIVLAGGIFDMGTLLLRLAEVTSVTRSMVREITLSHSSCTLQGRFSPQAARIDPTLITRYNDIVAKSGTASQWEIRSETPHGGGGGIPSRMVYVVTSVPAKCAFCSVFPQSLSFTTRENSRLEHQVCK